jgi:hypothetical protein
MNDLLIPFGVHRTTGDLVEPEDAEKGRACNCLCPGCKAPLLCRRPKIKRDHFAHDSHHKEARPKKHCPFSSAVAVAMMVRNLAPEMVGKMLATPSRTVMEVCTRCGKQEPIEVTRYSTNRIDEAVADVLIYGHRVDLKLSVAGFTVLVDLVYKGKQSPLLNESMLQEKRIAVLELSCDRFPVASLRRNRKLRFSEAILAFFQNPGDKHWRFHPRTKSLREKIRQDHQCRHRAVRPPRARFKRDRVYTSRERDDSFSLMGTLSHRDSSDEVGEMFEWEHEMTDPTVVDKENDAIAKRFECVLCNLCWVHHGSRNWKCPICNSYLYSREIG